MGSSKKTTVGYHYRYLLYYGLCQGPVDAFLEFRAGDRTAWSGELTSNASIDINQPNLWGGEKSEGGIVGSADVMFGYPTQQPSAYLASNLEPRQSAMRGSFCFVFKGGRFGINPYPKSVSFKVRRILAGWDSDAPWLPDFATIIMPNGTRAMNPAHMLLDSVMSRKMQSEPEASVDLVSFAAAAFTLYNEGFGLCTEHDHSREDSEQFQQRILNIIDGSLSQDRVDGKYRLDLIRGANPSGVHEALHEQSILEFEREPANPLEAINEIFVEYFDPMRKEKRVTQPQQSLGSIQAAGAIISETLKFPEIPDETLADRVAARELAKRSTPLDRFRLVTTRECYNWRAGKLFRLLSPRRGIEDMVCVVGEISAGTARSGAMHMIAVQDVVGMPSTTYTEPEPGVDPNPSTPPASTPAAMVFEAPYVDLAETLSNAELDALPNDAGYLMGVAVRPVSGMNYAFLTRAAGEAFEEQANGDWVPTGIINTQGSADPNQRTFTLTDAKDLNRVTLGTSAFWGSEMVRVDALNATTGAVTFGRGCGDTVSQDHAAGERVWFYDEWSSTDSREYVDGETVGAKFLTRTPGAQLDEALAVEYTTEMNQRAERPYPPALVDINGEAKPAATSGELTVTWRHRHRILQDDQLLDATAASIGPEPGTTYTIRWFLDGVADGTQTGLTGTTTTHTPSGDGTVRMELESVRGGLASWQANVREFLHSATLVELLATESNDLLTTEDGDFLAPD